MRRFRKVIVMPQLDDVDVGILLVDDISPEPLHGCAMGLCMIKNEVRLMESGRMRTEVGGG